MGKISATGRIVISLAGITTSLMLIAGAAGFFPDRTTDVMMGRMRLCESLAISFSQLATRVSADEMQGCFEGIADRNPEVESIGLRTSEGALLFKVGSHAEEWDASLGGKSSETQIVVPVFTAGEKWGAIEVRFRPIHGDGFLGVLGRREFTMAAFMAVACGVAFYAYLRRVLTQLNPSKVVPGRVREAFNALAEGILVLDSRRVVVLANRAMEQAIGAEAGALIGRPVANLDFVSREDDVATTPWEETLESRQPVIGRLLGRPHDEATFSVSASPILDEQGASRGVLASFENVTQLRRKQQELREMVHQLHISNSEIHRQNMELSKLANCDPLTGCRNRRSFFELFETLWSSATRYDTPMAAMMIDIDHFKSINDEHGHAMGDEVLRGVAEKLQQLLRDADVLCRYGGEEFAVVLPHTDLAQAVLAAERLRVGVAQLQFQGVAVTVSIGISALCQTPADRELLLSQADQCLYAAKRQGRNRCVRFDELDESDAAPAERRKDDDDAVQTMIPYQAVSALVSALSYRDTVTAGHSRRVADLCVKMSEGLLSLKDCYALEMAALLHDIGKIGVPDSILRKPGKLTESEWEVMRASSRIGCEIVRSSFATPALAELVTDCRERFEDAPKMPIGARILAVADAYDSMVSDQVYRDSLSHAEAVEELRRHAGTQFDPAIVERLARLPQQPALSTATPVADELPTVAVAMQIGAQIERLVAALDRQCVDDMRVLSHRLHDTAENNGAQVIADTAAELDDALKRGPIDMFSVMQIASELLDLCRSTQAALLQHAAAAVGAKESS